MVTVVANLEQNKENDPTKNDNTNTHPEHVTKGKQDGASKALFNYIHDNKAEIEKEMAEIKLILKDDVYYIVLKSDQGNANQSSQYINLYEGYSCERHIRVERTLVKQSLGKKRCYAHFSEHYKPLQPANDNLKYTAHLYFNKDGQCQGYNIKQADKYLEKTPDIEKILKFNSVMAHQILNRLLRQMAQRYKEEFSKLLALEAKLEVIVDLSNADNCERFVEVANDYINQLKKVNKYSDDDELVPSPYIIKALERINRRKEAPVMVSSSVSSIVSDTQTDNEVDEAALEDDDSSNNVVSEDMEAKSGRESDKIEIGQIENEAENLLKELDELFIQCNEIKPLSVSLQVKVHCKLKDLEEKLMELSILNDFSSKIEARRIQKLNEIKARMADNGILSISDLFIYCFQTQDVFNFKLLFSKFPQKMPLSLYSDLLRDTVQRLNVYERKRLIEICEFLFEKSAFYQSQVRLFNKIIDSVSVGEGGKTGVLDVGANRTILCQAMVCDCFDSFAMLLNQGADPNQIATIVNDVPIAMVRLSIHFDVKYTQMLLNFGGYVDYACIQVKKIRLTEQERHLALTQDIILDDSKKQHSFTKTLASVKHSKDKSNVLKKFNVASNDIALPHEKTSFDEAVDYQLKIAHWIETDLLVACLLEKYDHAFLLLEKTDLAGIVSALSSMAHTASKGHHFGGYVDKQFSIGFVTTETGVKRDLFNQLQFNFGTKMKNINRSDFSYAAIKLAFLTNRCKETGLKREAFDYYFSQLLLMCSQKPSYEQARKTVDLYYRMSFLFFDSDDPVIFMERSVRFLRFSDVVVKEFPEFSARLKQTDVYKDCQRRLELPHVKARISVSEPLVVFQRALLDQQLAGISDEESDANMVKSGMVRFTRVRDKSIKVAGGLTQSGAVSKNNSTQSGAVPKTKP